MSYLIERHLILNQMFFFQYVGNFDLYDNHLSFKVLEFLSNLYVSAEFNSRSMLIGIDLVSEFNSISYIIVHCCTIR